MFVNFCQRKNQIDIKGKLPCVRISTALAGGPS